MTEQPTTTPMLSLDAVSGWYGPAQALFDIALEVHDGEVVGLLGRNGAGKSSTFKAVLNLELRRNGHVRACGQSLDRLSADRIARSGVGWVPEDRRVFSTLTVAENLQLARFAGGDRGIVPTDELVDAFPLLGRLLDRKGNELSGGEQQVVSIARALASRPRVLLLDEPTEGLAPLVVGQLSESLRELPREFGVALLLAEQNLEFVLALADRAYILETGRVVYSGPSDQLAADRALQQRFLSVSAGR